MKTPRPWWLVWISSAAVPVTLGFAILAVIIETSSGDRIKGRSSACDGCSLSPEIVPTELILDYLQVWGWTMLIALAVAAIGITLVAWRERAGARPLPTWLFAVALPAAPLVVGLWLLLTQITASGDLLALNNWLFPAGVLCLALVGGATGRWVRHGSLTR